MASSRVKIILFTFLFLLFIPHLTSAEFKTFIKEYTYRASEIDSKVSCRTITLEQVKRLLLEELGSYLESHTEVINFKLTKDQIITLTGGIVQTQILEEKWDGENYWLKAKINADPDVVIKSIDALRKNQGRTKELEELKKRTEWLLRENEKLKNELGTSKSKAKTIGQYNQSIKDLQAIDWFHKAVILLGSGKYQEAIDALSRSIELSPEFAWGYYARGVIKYGLDSNRQAINDYDKAIKYGSGIEKADFYCGRGTSYERLKDYQQALKDYHKCIELNPGLVDGYLGRASIYLGTENYQQAIMECNNVIRMEPKNGEAYSRRGYVYSALEDYRHALEDYNKAIELNPKLYYNYLSRGVAHYFLKNDGQAIEDCNKAIELNPKYGIAYYWRGNAYLRIGHTAQSRNDYKIAARLGHKGAQAYLKTNGFDW